MKIPKLFLSVLIAFLTTQSVSAQIALNPMQTDVAWEYSTYTISLSGQLDEIRFHPANAQMTTYTFEPEIGMTSACDANNIVSYYEFDGFSRLSRIKDKDGNIVKSINYHYMSQQDSPSEQ